MDRATVASASARETNQSAIAYALRTPIIACARGYDTMRKKRLTWTQKLSDQLNVTHVARKKWKRRVRLVVGISAW